ncbi:MAG TPA: RNA 2',3'-cyclic phosphodiesterase [Thermoplasmata archaeon]|nr:RNA 2',3'-cyclic phosphodiesterase [Thermoplasmata archaeon]
MRAFIAVPVPDPTGPASAPHALEHLTLQFLGEIDADQIEPLERVLAPVALARPAFDVTVEGVDAFPSRIHPRVVWRGVSSGREELVQLALDVHRATSAVGVPADPSRYVPHLTLFRVRSAADSAEARALLDGRTSAPPPTRFQVAEVDLVESRRHASGAEHRVLARFPLATPSG